MLDIKPTISALRRSKAGAFLLLIQIAIATAIVSNASFIVYDRVQYISQDTGYPEDEVFSFSLNTFGDVEDLSQQMEQTEQLLRNMPGVIDAVYVDSVPLSGSGSASSFANLPRDQNEQENYREVRAAYIGADEHIFEALGVEIAEGRGFLPSDVIVTNTRADLPPVAIVSRSFLDEMFPEGDGLGQHIFTGNMGAQIIGVVEKMKGPWLKDSRPDNLLLIPYAEASVYQNFIVRTKAQDRSEVIGKIEDLLLEQYNERVIINLRGMDESKARYNAADLLMVRMLIVLMVILVLVTALGIFGLTVFNISKRTKQIGTRRALGARKSAIVRYFLVENSLVCVLGLAVGITGAIGLGHFLMTEYSLPKLSLYYVVATAIGVFIISLLSVLIPANKAANISPSIATRTI
ncbi:ABC transporter permease [Glaciecola sp. 1036]|uniref:ABC transporter permease n=1 Tax=Alteromonadaceae TaxID=72275 RepID=UPI003D0825A0